MDNMQLWIESSTTKMNLNSAVDGIFLNPELEGLTGLPEIRTTSGVNAGYDGGWTSAQYFDARLITVRGVIVDSDIAGLEAKRKALAALIAQGRKETLTLKFVSEGGNTYSVMVRSIGMEMALKRVFARQEFLIQLRADDPLIYDDGNGGGMEAIIRVQQALGGFEIPFEFPLAISGGSDTTIVENLGTEQVYPLITLYGPLHSPTVINRTTNQQMQILTDLDYVITWGDYQTKSSTNGSMQITDAIQNAPMSLTELDGNATQQTYTGKNLFDISKVLSNSPSLINNGNGTLTVKAYGTQGTNPATLADYCPTLQTGDTATLNATTTSTNKFVYLAGANTQWAFGASRTITATDLSSRVLWYSNNSDTTNVISNIQIELGSTPTLYEPFVGGTASPNPSYPQNINTVTGEQVVKVVGKNLADHETTNTLNAYISAANLIRPSSPDRMIFYPVQQNTDYTVSLTRYPIEGQPQDDVKIGFTETTPAIDVQVNNAAPSIYNTSIQQTLNSGSNNFIVIKYANSQRSDADATLATLQLEVGSQATSYEPFTSQSQEVNLGKNLLDAPLTTVVSKGITSTKNADGSITISGTLDDTWCNIFGSSGAVDYYLPAGTYTFSDGLTTATRPGWISLTPTLADGTTGQIMSLRPYQANMETKTYTQPIKKLRLVLEAMQVGTELDLTIYPQLEAGSQATSYAPYFTPIELCKIGTYQDKIYFDADTSKWMLHKEVGKVILTGSESWTRTGLTSGARFYTTNNNIGLKDANSNGTDIISDHFVGVNYTTYYSAGGVNGVSYSYYNGTHYIQCFSMDATLTNGAAFATWLASNPTTVYYVLATATDTEITNSALLEQLNHIYSLYGGVNNISIVPTGGAQGEIKISYATTYSEQRDEVVIDSQLRTITMNGADIYHLKSDSSEFIMLDPGDNTMVLTSAQTSDSGYAVVKYKGGHLTI